MASLEDAKHCPKCDQPGTVVYQQVRPKGGKAFTYHCVNALCKWFQTGWVVQVNADGSIPDRTAGPKQFEQLDSGATAYAEAVLQKTQKELMEGEVPN